MGLNNDGYSGVDIEQVALEKTILVGTQAPNTFPCMKIDQNKKFLPEMTIIESKGTNIESSAGYDCGYIDTSWISHGGNFNLHVGNVIKFSAGGGGFEWVTSGPSRISTPYQDFLCTHCFNVNTRLFRVASTERTHLMGTRIDIQYDSVYIMGNTNFTNNVHINGGLFVNGELFCSHMTSMGQTNFTAPCGMLKAEINAAQSFMVYNGASLGAEQLVIPSLGWAQADQLPDKPGFIDCYIAVQLPVIGLVEVPCRIGFPKGISLVSDNSLFEPSGEMSPTIVQNFTNANTRVPGYGKEVDDIIGSGHQHSFVGPSCEYITNTGEVYAQAKAAIESDTPASAKETVPNGCATLDQVPKMLMNAVQNSLWEYSKERLQALNPFKSLTGGSTPTP